MYNMVKIWFKSLQIRKSCKEDPLYEDPLPDDKVPLCFLVEDVPLVVPGDHHGPMLGGLVQDESVVVAGN